MMFKKYVKKLSNTIGTVNYLARAAGEEAFRSHSRRTKDRIKRTQLSSCSSSNNDEEEFESDCSLDLQFNRSRLSPTKAVISTEPTSDLQQSSSASSSTSNLSDAITQLRYTLFFYPLVVFFVSFFCFVCFWGHSTKMGCCKLIIN